MLAGRRNPALLPAMLVLNGHPRWSVGQWFVTTNEHLNDSSGHATRGACRHTPSSTVRICQGRNSRPSRTPAAERLRELLGIEGGDPFVVLDMAIGRLTKDARNQFAANASHVRERLEGHSGVRPSSLKRTVMLMSRPHERSQSAVSRVLAIRCGVRSRTDGPIRRCGWPRCAWRPDRLP
jgi:hypothetical protein